MLDNGVVLRSYCGLQIADLPAVYHVSLSRVVPVRHPDINPLVAALKDCLSKTTK